MCGIVGVAALQGQPVPSLERAVEKIAHRGPDGKGIYSTGQVILGHTRLAILDPSDAGAQPMVSHNGKFAMVYNGEIYNFAELRDELSGRGVVFRGHSDSEVLLEGYAHFGVDVLKWLNGIFAFAIVNIENQDLFVARDHLGIKPLYWAEGAFGFAFASEIKALVCAVPISKEIDRVTAEQHLTYIWSPGERTMFKEVKKLEPGTAIIVRDGRIARRISYWDAPQYRPRFDWTKADCTASLAQCVSGAVERQMVSDVPVGAFLSGGLDSTAIVASARAIDPNISCFTMAISGGMQGEMTDDLKYARIAAKSLDVRLTEIEIKPSDILSNIESMIQSLDEPLADPACLNLKFMAAAARESGIKVLLSGTGGDDLFSGYRRHVASRYNRFWDYIPARLRAGVSNAVSGTKQNSSRVRQVAKILRDIGRDRNSRIASLFAWCSPETARGLMLTSDMDDERAFNLLLSYIENLGDMPDLEKCLALDRRYFLADHNLTYTDKMGMAVGTEIRVPLLDLEVVKFAATIPADWKFAGGEAKGLFKQSQIGRVPSEILNRPKSGFGVPLRSWINAELRPMAMDLLSSETVRRRGLFDANELARLFSQNEAGKIDATYTLFSAMCIELWCQSFVDT